MKLDRNTNPDGKGKYSLINNRTGKIEHGEVGSDDEFFVIKLKDKYALPALIAYSRAAYEDEEFEWADEVFKLAEIADKHPNKKKPD